jgi:tetratricopeptide (TPR) repeat protein
VGIITLTDIIIRGGLCVGKVVVIGTSEKTIAEQKKYINEAFNGKDYEACIGHCDFLLKLLPKDEKSRKIVKAFCLRKQADCLGRVGRFEEGLVKAAEAKIDCCRDDFNKAIYAEALIYKKMGDNDNASRCLDEVIKWCSRNEMYYELAKALDTKAHLLKSPELFYEAIDNYELAEKEADWDYIDKEKFYKEISGVYCRLIETLIHINSENKINIYDAFNHITNEEIKAEAEQMISNLYGKEV